MAGFGSNAPYDYSVQQPDIAGSLLGGIQAGEKIAASRRATDLSKQYSEDLHNTLANPTPQAFSALIAKYPQQQKAFQASWGILNKEQQDQQFSAGTQAYSAIQNGKPEVAVDLLDKQITAMQNAGQDASNLTKIKEAVQRDPQGAGGQIALSLSSFDPDRWGKIAGEMRESAKAPAEQSLAEAKATKAATDAKFAESKAVQDLAKGGWDISKIQNDIGISRQNAQIAAMNAATARQANGIKSQGNDLKLQELQLKLQDKVQARDQAVQQKAAEVSNARGSIDNFLNTADRVLKTDPSVVGSAAGPISSRTPTLSQDTADFEELVNTLSSQAFMSQIPSMKGLGALSEKEGEKLQSSLQNLSLRQSPERLLENVKEAQRLILKSRSNLSQKYGVPDVTPDTPAAQPSPTNIEALLQKYGGQ
jgi:hypothetical protein